MLVARIAGWVISVSVSCSSGPSKMMWRSDAPRAAAAWLSNAASASSNAVRASA